MKNGPLLHVDDDEDDVTFLALAFEEVGITNPVHVVRDGQEAIDFLKAVLERGQTSQAVPVLIMLDLKLPRIMGLDVLRWIRQQPVLRKLPVLVLSASDHPMDLSQAREVGASAYFVKPCSLDKRTDFARLLKLWLMDAGELPNSPESAFG